MSPNIKHLSRILLIVFLAYTLSWGLLFSLQFIVGVEPPLVLVELTSMLPTLKDGDMLLLQGLDNSDMIDIDEIIVFYDPGSIKPQRIVHRIINVQIIDGKVHFITKGDNNPIADHLPVPLRNVVGVVLGKVPIFLAEYIKFIDSFGVKMSMLGILFLLFILKGSDFLKKESLIQENMVSP
ncbi:unnamed protein product [marine sediment metagenome]|uniref:Signal peptidase I n=1 Tax=marine sediment metagenome TaxID=412755 RepID=X0SV27_9ZZZZ